MNKLRFTIIGLLVILSISCSKKPILSSSYQSSPLSIDGNPGDWGDSLAFDKDSKVHYRISNDEEYLYFLLSAGEPDILRKIRMTGFTLWIDPDGKKKQIYGINYPMKRMDGVRRGSENRIPGGGLSPEISRVLGVKDIMKLTGFEEKGEIVITGLENSEGIKVKTSFSNLPWFFYEAGIPLKLIVGSPESFLQDTTNMISVGFETGIEQMPMNQGGRPGMSQGRGGGRPGGTMGGRGGASQKGQRPGGRPDNVLQHVEFWLPKVRLSGIRIDEEMR